jgi:hypothetical protein
MYFPSRRRPRRPPNRILARVIQLSFALHLFLLVFEHAPLPDLESRVLCATPISPPVTIFAAFMTDQNSTRAADLLSYISESSIPMRITFDYWLINWTTFNDTARRFLYPPPYYRKAMRHRQRFHHSHKHFDLGAKFFFSLRFFLMNTTHSWFYRATDDTIVNFKNLGPYMAYLESKWNPRTDSVVVGNCIDTRFFSYLQGGVGILFSRAAASRISVNIDEFFARLNRPEDVSMTPLLIATNVTLYQATSEYFIGHDIYTVHRYLFWNNSLHTHLPPCPRPEQIWAKACRSFVAPVADLVFWHQEGKNQTLGQTIMFAKWVFAQPRWIKWWMNKGRPWLCRDMNVSKRLY